MSAGAVQPRDSDAVPKFEMGNSSTKSDDDAGAFVSGNEGQGWLDWPVAFGRVQVGMTDAAGHDFHEGLPGARSGYWNFLNDKRFAELLNHRCLHGSWNCHE